MIYLGIRSRVLFCLGLSTQKSYIERNYSHADDIDDAVSDPFSFWPISFILYLLLLLLYIYLITHLTNHLPNVHDISPIYHMAFILSTVKNIFLTYEIYNINLNYKFEL